MKLRNLIFFFLMLTVLLSPLFLFAQGDGDIDSPRRDDRTRVIELENPLGVDNITEFLDRVINFLLIVAFPIAVIMTIWAGYLFMTARDSQQQVEKARKTLLYVVIGVAILILSKGLVSLVASFLELSA